MVPGESILQKYFADSLGEALSPLGFKRADSMVFERARGELRDVVTAGLRPHSKVFALGLGSVGLLLPSVEKLRRDLRGSSRSATVGIGLHLLLPGREFVEWAVTTSADIDEAVPKLLRALRSAGLPFFKAFQTVNDVKARLLNSDPASWFTCSEDARGAILVLVEGLEKGTEAAIALAADLLSALSDRPPKYSFELRGLLQALRNQ